MDVTNDPGGLTEHVLARHNSQPLTFLLLTMPADRYCATWGDSQKEIPTASAVSVQRELDGLERKGDSRVEQGGT